MNASASLDPEFDLDTLSAHEWILSTAYRLFYRDGIRATGIDRVIAEAHVTKVTFYRHFASKDLLILAYLDVRHERWIRWFNDALERHSSPRRRGRVPIVSALEEWLTADTFRGCAFINSVNEIGAELPETLGIATRHKSEMVECIKATLPPGPHRARTASALGVAVDGAIVHAQHTDPASAVKALATIAQSLTR